jgi:hypothetical protein
MGPNDFDAFAGLLDQLCAAWDRPPAKDELAKGYWKALRDVSLKEIEVNVERILRTAVGKQPFPKPAELRNARPVEVNGAGAMAFQDAEQRSIRNLEDLKRRDEEAWRREVRLRYLDRRMATEWEGSPIYAQAKVEWLRLRGGA